MITNIYLCEGEFIDSRVDETTSHQLGDTLMINDNRYIVIKVEEKEHYDYLSLVRVNTLVSKPTKDNPEGVMDREFET